MERRGLGRQGPEISVIGYGAWEAGGDWWGPNRSDQRVIDAMRAAVDAGMTWIDTAETYGRGRSEELVGRAVKDIRDRVLVFSKVAPDGNGTGFRPQEVRKALAASLGRLGIEHLDLYQLHWPSRSVPLEDTWGTMAELQDEGLVRHIGLSNVGWSDVERCLAIRHVDSVQNELSLLRLEDRRRLLPRLAEAGVGYLAYSPLGLGMLTGAVTADTEFDPEDFRGGGRGDAEVPEQFRPENLERTLGRVRALRAIAERLGCSLPSLALRWVVQQPGVTAAIAGSRDPDHVRDNARAGDLRLDADTLKEIDAIFT
jgi:aryl-alcohol dehydrogenase-like predicted oxidoreductase